MSAAPRSFPCTAGLFAISLVSARFGRIANGKGPTITSVGEIRSVLKAQPFRPFAIHLADQRWFLVSHPEYAYVDPRGRFVIVTQDDGSYDLANMLLVTGIHLVPGQYAEKID